MSTEKTYGIDGGQLSSSMLVGDSKIQIISVDAASYTTFSTNNRLCRLY
jgi:hypothetical protein